MHTIIKNAFFYLEETQSVQEPQAQQAAVKRLNDYWEANRLYLESVVVHNDLEEAGAALSHLESAAQCEDRDDFLAAANLLRRQLEHIAQMEALRLGNIL